MPILTRVPIDRIHHRNPSVQRTIFLLLQELRSTIRRNERRNTDHQIPSFCRNKRALFSGVSYIIDEAWARRVNRIQHKMLKSVSPRLSPRGGAEPRIIRLTTDQEAVLQEQFNRCPRAPHTADIVLLAAETGLSEADVQGWYAIRLAQWRKEQGLGGNLHFSN
ncbi:uncharacterized protein LOC124301179 isoform X1 [Neodiprion virginianus]|uniref:uncharacterized protein LOC124301179 isoform X1 n=1 Tax=Neodiprion virginianus TaxID=2961670 RepID=UPI001EE6F6F9|nr:uncharacterized protein LOC124301179 isoform X1 [Neodiprion virginianus]